LEWQTLSFGDIANIHCHIRTSIRFYENQKFSWSWKQERKTIDNILDRLTNNININLYYNMTSFIGYINNTMIKLKIYFNSHMRIDEQIRNIIPQWIHVFIHDRGAYKHKNVIARDKMFTKIMLPMLKLDTKWTFLHLTSSVTTFLKHWIAEQKSAPYKYSNNLMLG
jgi:hypothetical protein